MLNFRGGWVVSGSSQREPSTTESACTHDSGGHGGVVGGGGEREPTTAENEHAHSILGVMGGHGCGGGQRSSPPLKTLDSEVVGWLMGAVVMAARESQQPPKMSANARFWQLWG